jgi:iron complex outermembrane receptor protein
VVKRYFLFLFLFSFGFIFSQENGVPHSEGDDAAAEQEAIGSKFEDYLTMEDDEGLTINAEAPPMPPVLREKDAFGERSIVGEDQIARQGSLDLNDTLRNVPGVTAIQRNAVGANTGPSIFIRGRGASHPSLDTTVSFDGIGTSGAIYGQPLADAIPVFAAEAVEVFKSPQPVNFSGAYGLVNVRGRQMRGEGLEVMLGSNYGSFGTYAADSAIGYASGGFDLLTAASWIRSEGHVRHSGADQKSAYLNLGFSINDVWGIRFMGNMVNAETEQPPSKYQHPAAILPVFKTESLLGSFTLTNDFKKATGFLKMYYSGGDFYYLYEDNMADDWSLQNMDAMGIKARETVIPWEDGEITAGFDLDTQQNTNEDHNKVDASGNPRASVIYDFPDTVLFTPYTGISHYYGNKRAFHIQGSAGIRGYIHNLWANTFTPQAGLTLGYNRLDFSLNYSWAAVYPSMANIQGLSGNTEALNQAGIKAVKPETSYHYEAGLSYSLPGWFSANVSAFFDDGRDRIIASSFGVSVPQNASRSSYFKIYGLDAGIQATPFDPVELYAGASLLRVRAKGEDGREVEYLPYTPPFSMNAGFKLHIWKLTLTGDYQHISGMYAGSLMRAGGSDDGSAFTRPNELNLLDPINLLNLRLSFEFDYKPWNINKGEVYFSVKNVLNQEYEYYKNYPMPGISFTGGMKVTFR